MDGVRAFWNGKEMISKQSKRIICPTWFINELPQEIALDGELWLGRGKFEMTKAILQSNIHDKNWKNINFVIFDLPHSKELYENRMEELKKIKLPSHTKVVSNIQCEGNNHLMKLLSDIVAEGGEGLMANQPQSPYLAERTPTLLKVKAITENFRY